MEEFNLEVVARLPLAEAVLQRFAYLADEGFLGELFQKYRGRSYEGVLSFGTMVNLLTDALLECDGSGHRAILQAQANDQLEASSEAWYGKLRRIPQSLSPGFLSEGTQGLLGILPCTTPPSPRAIAK